MPLNGQKMKKTDKKTDGQTGSEERNAIHIDISVRDLVEFILRSGDIDNRIAQGDMNAMQDGSRLHKKLQKAAGEDYRSEVKMKIEAAAESDGESVVLVVEGRADGIFTSDELTYIDEIKTTLRNVKSMTEPVGVHRAQAMCYAYFYAYEYQCGRVGIRMTYCNRDNEEVAYFKETFGFEELKEWFDKLVNEYAKWAVWEIKWRRKRDETIRNAAFPFEYREGQKKLVTAVYKTIGSGKKLFIEAPTGVGKTMSTVFPAVWSMGEGKTEKIFYGTAKTIARTVAEEAFEILRNKGLKFRSVTITAKEKLCVLDKPECNPEACPRAKGHFDRVNDCVYDMLTHEERIDRDIIAAYAEKHCVCPFEMCLDVTLWADAVICDYNYLFDPTVHLKRFFDGEKKKYCLLIDEAHNLVERAREMYSAELIKEDILSAKIACKDDSGEENDEGAGSGNKGKKSGKGKDDGGQLSLFDEADGRKSPAEGKNNGIQEDKDKEGNLRSKIAQARGRTATALEALNKSLLTLKRETDGFQVWDGCDRVALSAERFCGIYEEVSRDLKLDTERSGKVRDVYFAARHFAKMHDEMEDDYEVYSNYTEDRHFRLRLQCMDPSRKLKEYLILSEHVIMFSATLLPIKYYMEQLGGGDEDYSVYAPSPFDRNKRLLMVGYDVSTKYTRRTDDEYNRIADYIAQFTGCRKGNYLVYFPSYAVMEEVAERIGDRIESLSLQGRSMSEQEKEAFLEAFTEDPDLTHVGFCVMGGLFAEGIDLKNDRLIGVAVVGTGLPMVCDERELFRNYFDNKNDSGFEYAYLYNGMNKVMQAAGRVIRTMEDTGAILLLDERFLNRQYLELFPREWSDYRKVTYNSINKELEDFWKIH